MYIKTFKGDFGAMHAPVQRFSNANTLVVSSANFRLSVYPCRVPWRPLRFHLGLVPLVEGARKLCQTDGMH